MIRAVLWDIGNVLIRWDARALFRKLFDDPVEMETFLAEVWTAEHNTRCDAGETFAAVIAEVVAEHPHYEPQIRAAWDRWIETIPGPVDHSLELLRELRDAGYRQVGVTNFSAETFPKIRGYEHLDLLDHVVVSGQVGLMKPDPAIFALALEHAGVEADRAVFVDDSMPNVEGARRVGIHAIHFVGVAELRRDLAELGVPAPGGFPAQVTAPG